MATRMLIDATHPEETRVVVVKGNRLEEFDFETSTKRTLKGNIYLAKVTRVEPSLQAAFVDYGGNRHGFLAFNEIHPDYYQIPIADRQALLERQRAEDEREAAAEERAAQREAEAEATRRHRPAPEPAGAAAEAAEEIPAGEPVETAEAQPALESPFEPAAIDAADDVAAESARAESTGAGDLIRRDEELFGDVETEPAAQPANDETPTETDDEAPVAAVLEPADDDGVSAEGGAGGVGEAPAEAREGNGEAAGTEAPRAEDVVSVGGDAFDEVRRPRRGPPPRQYRIQEVIKRRQIMLVQVVKEERGNKGAALTTFLSLAGRYCVLMPNTARGGGISRKIVSAADRKRLKSITSELDVPEGMGVIVRTAGMERSKAEIKRDFEFLLRTWDNIRELTLQSTAPCLVYEEANLIKRAIRDLYNKDIDEVHVEGEDGYRAAKDFMKMLMPSHAKRVQPYRDRIPLFHRFQIENQLDGMYNPTVQLRSGGYIVLNPTEALVAIDVNSGKATREHNIEETAYKTNSEAAEEIARQLRLRDLAGLIVIDFIDMEEGRNIRNVERRLKECLKADRARIQVGHISAFGLLEMSRQRLRPSLIEASTLACPHCQGRGYVRSIESAAVHVLRAIEDEGIRERSGEIAVHVATRVGLYILNQKREALVEIEQRYGMRVQIIGDDSLVPPEHRIERLKGREAVRAEPRPEERRAITAETVPYEAEAEAEAEVPVETAKEAEAELEAEGAAEAKGAPAERRRPPHPERGRGETDEAREGRRRRRRRGRRGRHGVEAPIETPMALPTLTPANALEAPIDEFDQLEFAQPAEGGEAAGRPAGAVGEDAERRRRRRGRRGGRRRRREREGFEGGEQPVEQQPEVGPIEAGMIAAGEPAPFMPEELPAPPPVPAAEPVALAPAAEPEPIVTPEPEPAPPAPATTEPVVISTAEPEVEKPRRGWWRRR